MDNFSVRGNIVDIVHGKIFPGEIFVAEGKISRIEKCPEENFSCFIMPGFVDAHVHIESSMLVPSEFARLAVLHGTIATVSDPHEIANVLGVRGVEYMLENAEGIPFKFYFGAPSCVPATRFETAGAEITSRDIEQLFLDPRIRYLSEMMNYPGVLHQDHEVIEKIRIAQKHDRPIDGHAPGLRGADAAKYISAGISTDHECFELDEAIQKLDNGMKIIIREGSAAKNYDALHSLLVTHPEFCMFGSDDKHPNDLIVSHIDELVRRSVRHGYDLFSVLRAASMNPALHYGLNVGLLREGDPADFIIVNNLEQFRVDQTYINGHIVAEHGRSLIEKKSVTIENNFSCEEKNPEDFEVEAKGKRIRVIEALEGQLITKEGIYPAKIENGKILPDIENDILKIAVVNRYKEAPPSVGFIKNFGLKRGAIASSVAHDSHNIIAVGTSDEEICAAVNALIRCKGGIAAVEGELYEILPLEIAGLMSAEDGFTVAKKYSRLDTRAKELGSKLFAPFMTLSFMALLVIPQLKLSDRGLFDGEKFVFTDVCVQ